MYKSIMVPIDKSTLSDLSLEVAFGLAEAFGAKVTVVYARANPGRQDPTDVAADVIDVDLQTSAVQKVVDKALVGRSMPRDRVHVDLRAGGVRAAILGAADEFDVDLIVMASHGRHGFVDAVTGSTAEQIVAGARASVLVVHSPAHGLE